MTQRVHHKVRNVTIAVDLALINLGFGLAYLARYDWQWLRGVESQFFHPYRLYLPQQILLNLFLAVAFSQTGVWRRRRGEVWLDEVVRIGYAMTASFTMLVAYQYIVRPEANSRIMVFWAALFIGVLLALARLARRTLLAYFYSHGRGVDRVLVVGSGEPGRGIIRTLLARPDLGFQAVGYLSDEEDTLGSRRIPYLGHYDQLERAVGQNPYLHTVFIALPAVCHNEILQISKLCLDHGIQAQIVPDFFQLSLGHVEAGNLGGVPTLTLRDVSRNPTAQLAKRLMDLFLVSLFALPALLITAVVAIAVKLDDGGPVFYRAERFGKGGKPFAMYKFRSMVINADQMRAELWQRNEADGPIFKIKDDPRLTRVGRIIRRLSLDELPQFYNILRGDMSFVGPRPPIRDEVEQYRDWHHRRFDVHGGLTGLWQVSGRADLTFDETVLLDIYYIENWSLTLDLRIFLQTVPYILLRRGAY